MPDKHPNTQRWGGPGASHEDASKPMLEPAAGRPTGAVGSRPNVSQVSGGGGEQDEKHSHVDGMRSSKSHATDSPSPTSTRAWRQNRSRRDQAADRAEAEAAGEPRSFEAEEADGGEPEAAFQVLVNTDDNVSGADPKAQRIRDAVLRSLSRFSGRLTRVEVFLTDVNASKSGPGDKRCSMEARPSGSGPVAASHTASTVDEAVSGAAGKLGRLLDTQLGRRRDHKGGDSIRGSF